MAAQATPEMVRRMEFVPNRPFRDAILRAIDDGRVPSMQGFARWLEADPGQFRRELGYARPDGPPQRFMSYRRAVQIARELGLDPTDYGI